MTALVPFLLAFLVWCQHAEFGETTPSPVLTIQSAPERPIIELRDANQFLNFDLIVRNVSRLTLRLSEIQLAVYDSAHSLVMMKSLNTDAFAPSIEVIGKQTMAPGEHLDVFNPFFRFDSTAPLTELRYSFCLLREDDAQQRERNSHRLPDDCDFRQQITIVPRTYADNTSLILPLRGKIFTWEGHDFFSHHLRVPLGDPDVQRRGITANSNDFASDFIYVDDQDERITTIPESWRTGTATASPSTRREPESFLPQPMTSLRTGLKIRKQR